jgi:hypothetical protein
MLACNVYVSNIWMKISMPAYSNLMFESYYIKKRIVIDGTPGSQINQIRAHPVKNDKQNYSENGRYNYLRISRKEKYIDN